MGAEREAYLVKIWKEVAKNQEFNESDIFSNEEIEYSHVHKVVTAHIILITKFLYEIDLKDFQKIAQDKMSFYETVRRSLPPEQKNVLI